MIWINVEKDEESGLASYNLIEGEYPAIMFCGDYIAPVSKDRANSTLYLRREGGVLQLGIPEEIYYECFDSDNPPKGLDIVCEYYASGLEEDRFAARIGIY